MTSSKEKVMEYVFHQYMKLVNQTICLSGAIHTNLVLLEHHTTMRYLEKGGLKGESITIANFNDQVHLMKYATGHYYKGVAKTKERERERYY